MTQGDHTTYRDEVGAYLLGALSDAERAAFEQHLAGCADCRALRDIASRLAVGRASAKRHRTGEQDCDH